MGLWLADAQHLRGILSAFHKVVECKEPPHQGDAKMGERSNRKHNKGQQDGSRGKNNPPHGELKKLLTWTRGGLDRISRDNGAYEVGRREGNKKRR